jgi:hypothetical protein
MNAQPLPELPAPPRRARPLDVARRPAPAGWPFAPLTDAQHHARACQEVAVRNGTLRGLPSVFGDLS